MIPDVYIYRVNIPGGVGGMSTPDTEDDGYTVYVDSRLPNERALEIYSHEMGHILRGDFEKDDADQIEADAHGRDDHG